VRSIGFRAFGPAGLPFQIENGPQGDSGDGQDENGCEIHGWTPVPPCVHGAFHREPAEETLSNATESSGAFPTDVHRGEAGSAKRARKLRFSPQLLQFLQAVLGKRESGVSVHADQVIRYQCIESDLDCAGRWHPTCS
jgi:hypothetical protein